ncbi:integrase core domain-containing protein [Halomonas sp. hl-4]|uniref:integrase core domain-containing protein n=1 Tax=Halomonas sp. hl-4 TaxID=1761789 RepID=UPI0012FD7F3C
MDAVLQRRTATSVTRLCGTPSTPCNSCVGCAKTRGALHANLQHTQVVIEAWRREYNVERPKRSHGGLAPSAYAEQLVVKHDKVTSDFKLGCY